MQNPVYLATDSCNWD